MKQLKSGAAIDQINVLPHYSPYLLWLLLFIWNLKVFNDEFYNCSSQFVSFRFQLSLAQFIAFKKNRREEQRKKIIILPFLRGSFVSFIYFYSLFPLHSDSLRVSDDVMAATTRDSYIRWFAVVLLVGSSWAYLTRHSTFIFSMALL